MQFFSELKRRNVFRVGAAYLVASWLLLQIVDVVGPILGLPDTLARYLLFLLVVGFVPALVFAWVFELTPDGVKRESEIDHLQSVTPRTGRRLDRAIMVVLALAVGMLLFDKLILQDNPAEPASKPVRTVNPETVQTGSRAPETGRRSVAVLPFVVMSNGPDDDYFADGLTEEIINSLAQLPELLVTARTSAFHFKGQNLPVGDIAAQLGVEHVVEGSVRRAGEQLRITAQLIRAGDGFHLWSETYDRRTADTLAVQEDIAEKIAEALDVVLDESRRKLMHQAGVRNVEAFIEYQKGRELFEKAHGGENQISLLRQANRYFENAVAIAPAFPDAYLLMSDLHTHVLTSHSSGALDGNITAQDVRDAPAALRRNYDLAMRHAWNEGQRSAADFDRAFTLGQWHGLAGLARKTLVDPGCETAYWSHNVSSPFGYSQLAFESFRQLAECDPMQRRPWVHMIRARLWQGDIPGTIATGDYAMRIFKGDNPWGVRSYYLALAQAGRVDEAEQGIRSRLRVENEKLIAQFMVAATVGDAARMESLQIQFLSKYGPNDTISLMMEALRGNRNEANRIANLIDRRPSGYLSLVHAVFWCACGAPFDLDSTPVFEEMLYDSGLQWPPADPLEFPLKTW